MKLTAKEKLIIAISALREIAKIHTFWYDEYSNKIHDRDCSGCKANLALYKMGESKE